MTMQSTLSRSLQMTLCAAAAACAMGAAHAQTPPQAKLAESSSTQTPVQASPTLANSTDGRKDKDMHSSTTAPSKSSMEARQPAQAAPTNARSTDGRQGMSSSSSHSTNNAPSQSQMEAQKPPQASPNTPGSTTGR